MERKKREGQYPYKSEGGGTNWAKREWIKGKPGNSVQKRKGRKSSVTCHEKRNSLSRPAHQKGKTKPDGYLKWTGAGPLTD